MENIPIDLCDSDDDLVVDVFEQEDDDSSSSSSEDSYLWKAGGFLKGSPKKKEEIRRGNYFKEVRRKNGDPDDDKRKMKRKMFCSAHGTFGSPIVSLEVNDDVVEDSEVDSSRIKSSTKHMNTTRNREDGEAPIKRRVDVERKSPHESYEENKLVAPSLQNCTKVKKKEFQEVECIEIDLSDSSSPGGKINMKRSASDKGGANVKPVSRETATRHPKPDNDRSTCLDSDSLDSDLEFQITENSSMGEKTIHTKKKSYDPSDKNSSHSADQLGRKQPTVVTKGRYPHEQMHTSPAGNKNRCLDNGNSSRSSDSTVSLPTEMLSSAMKKNKKTRSELRGGEFAAFANERTRVSFKNSGDIAYGGDQDLCGVDFSFGSYGEFGEDDVKLPVRDISESRYFKKERIKATAKTKPTLQSFVNGDVELLEDDSDDSISNSSAELFTPRPFKSNLSKSADINTGENLDYNHDEDDVAEAEAEAEAEAKSMKISDIKEELESYGVSTRTFLEKNELIRALINARRNNKNQRRRGSDINIDDDVATTTTARTTSSETQYPNSSISSSKLSTPRALSPATTSPTLGAYDKRKVPTPAIPAMSPSLVKELGGKLYPDLRHNFLLALTSHARRLRNNSYQRGSFDASLRSIVVIGLHLRPLRSAEAARRIKGVGSNFYDLLKESSTGGKGKKPFSPAIGKYSCVAAAALVALLELEEANASVASANGLLFPLESLIQKINELLDARANASLNQTAEKYLDPNNLDPGWGQIKKLASPNTISDLGGPFIKERKKKGASSAGRLYELLDNGREFARKLRCSARAGPAEHGPLRQFPDETGKSARHTSLFSHLDEEFGAVTMSMDFREGGGGGKSLHKMCDQLDIRGVPYVVRELKIADYLFFAGGKMAPILIERKTAEDVANSLYDGRWERQQRSMRKAQYVLGGGPKRKCQICYIIEGDPSRKTVHGGNVGRHNWFQSVEDVTQAIAKLPILGFSVMESKGILDTIGILAKVAEDVSWKAKNGCIDAIFSYEEFLGRVKVLGDDIGDPPTSRDHQYPAPPIVVNSKQIPEHFRNRNDTETFSPQSNNVQSNAQSRQETKAPGTQSAQEENSDESSLKKMTLAQLKDLCKERDENISGKKDDLIARLLKPRKPEILIMRTRRNEYVPKVPSCNAALMVALLLNHVPGTQGMSKERLMVLAEETGVSGESMSGKGGFYDGWAGVKQLLQGDPALVRKEKGHRYSLTTQPPETSGRAIAHALHILAHREGICNCRNIPEE